MTLRSTPVSSSVLPALALTFNAFVWGVSWWPFRQFQAQGLHPLWTTALIYALAVLLIAAAQPRALAHLARTPVLWVLVLASGSTNAAFNWGVAIGDVVRVVLLFYLMPLWALLLARVLLHERIDTAAGLRMALALGGAAIVLWPDQGGLPLPRSLAEALGVLGGFCFALNNVMLRREAHQPAAARGLAMFLGGAVVAGSLAALLTTAGHAPAPTLPTPAWGLAAVAFSLCFIASNLALQYGASRLPANVTAVVMLSELLFASVSAFALGAGTFTWRLLAGGALIVTAVVLAARRPRAAH
ncbi:DMT family transporter [Azohydromonas caseinilytica]|uniref:DMT family transporter n=1 Tax=Azohydromonas caseinilytica TaxID=2728836 RepID=A0A848F367_9BURK|nr:DMT family transporter [Azohydromonas caseinilytica]NML13842.1 DMT family transporter [Azohydromonas caseinilytica]